MMHNARRELFDMMHTHDALTQHERDCVNVDRIVRDATYMMSSYHACDDIIIMQHIIERIIARVLRETSRV